MPKVMHFEIHAENPQRAMAFYNAVLGWQFTQYGTQEYWLIRAGDDDEPGANGGLTRRAAPPISGESTTFVCIVSVPRLDEALERIERSGGRITEKVRAVPGIGWLAYCTDTEKNLFGLFQADPAAT